MIHQQTDMSASWWSTNKLTCQPVDDPPTDMSASWWFSEQITTIDELWMNELYNLYPASETRWSSSSVIFLWLLMFRLFGVDSQIRMWAIIPLFMEWKLGVLTQVIAGDFCCFSQQALHGVRSPCSHRCVMQWDGHVMYAHVLFVSSTLGIVFNLSADTITDHSQSAKDRDPYFMYTNSVKDPGHWKPVPYILAYKSRNFG